MISIRLPSFPREEKKHSHIAQRSPTENEINKMDVVKTPIRLTEVFHLQHALTFPRK
jgi:hypothetical protein